ncbi:hypothetical protein AB0O34_34185 [Sphaerisporangium sp. NPDC088356]|uniref:hypothetical protein n=1 Tax=Sphaerisporangium sp. NPDC088356 TaxID=3154871 RepID=UPI00344723B6
MKAFPERLSPITATAPTGSPVGAVQQASLASVEPGRSQDEPWEAARRGTESARQRARDARRALRPGPAAIAERQRARSAEIVAYARARSPYFREFYRELPEGLDDPALLPVTKADHVTLEHAKEPPEQSAGGKFRRIISLTPP